MLHAHCISVMGSYRRFCASVLLIKCRWSGLTRMRAYFQALLAVVRLPQHGSDLLITLNTPTFISGVSAAAEHAGAYCWNASHCARRL